MQTINKELTEANLLVLKNKILKEHEHVFKKFNQVTWLIACLSTLPTHRPQNESDVSFVENRFIDNGMSESLVKE